MSGKADEAQEDSTDSRKRRSPSSPSRARGRSRRRSSSGTSPAASSGGRKGSTSGEDKGKESDKKSSSREASPEKEEEKKKGSPAGSGFLPPTAARRRAQTRAKRLRAARWCSRSGRRRRCTGALSLRRSWSVAVRAAAFTARTGARTGAAPRSVSGTRTRWCNTSRPSTALTGRMQSGRRAPPSVSLAR